MTLGFMGILLVLTLFSGIIYLIDVLYWKKHRSGDAKIPTIIEYSRSFFPVLLIVLVIRSFFFQIYHVPSGSLEPTVKPGDIVFVTQYNYGLHLPVTHQTILKIGEPKRGDIALFRWPVNPHVAFIKRIVGVPGDKISYVNKVLYVNGKPAKQTLIKTDTDSNSPQGPQWEVNQFQENLAGKLHDIYVCQTNEPNCPNQRGVDFKNLVVPKGEYFAMGDNRDDSDDSRDWGLVPAKNFIGKGAFILFSYKQGTFHIRWDRIGRSLTAKDADTTHD